MNTTYFLNTIMGNVFGTDKENALPTKYYIGLSSTKPNVSGEDVKEPETAGTGYERVELNSLTKPEEGAIHNNAAISFNESLQDWGVMTHYVVYDEPTGGHLLFYGELTSKRTVEINTILTIKTGELIIELSNPAE